MLACSFSVVILVLSRVAAVVVRRFFVVILVVSGSSTSSTFIFRGNSLPFGCSAMVLKGLKQVSRCNSRTFSALQLLRCSFFVVILVLFVGLGWFFMVCSIILVLFGSFGSSTSSMFIFRGNSRTFCWSGMVSNGFSIIILVFFSSSTS